MLPDGLHVALASWLDARRSYDGFLAVPRGPLTIPDDGLSSAATQVPPYAAEFAILANSPARHGQTASAHVPPRLWEVHRSILEDMDHAQEPWSEDDEEALQRARSVLYNTDGTPTAERLAYQEMATVVRTLRDTGAPEDQIQSANADWVVLGFKNTVEDAFDTITRLMARSSRRVKENDLFSLQPGEGSLALGFYQEQEYGMTYFTPVSAADESTWSTATVSFDELRGTAPAHVRSIGSFVRSSTAGVVEFGFATLDVSRPWFSERLYQSDDWRLVDSQFDPVSAGDGKTGSMPAYIQSVYCVRAVKVGGAPVPKPVRRRPTARWKRPVQISREGSGLVATRAAGQARPHSALMARPGTKAAVAAAIKPKKRPTLASGKLAIPTSATALIHASIRRDDWRTRLGMADLVARRPGGSNQATRPSFVSDSLVVGFGCRVVPASPRPNPGYTW